MSERRKRGCRDKLTDAPDRFSLVVSGAGGFLRHAMRWLRRLNWKVVSWILFVKVTLFIFGPFAVQAISGRRISFWKTWEHWDAVRYLQIAKDGYVTAGKERFNLVGLPLYPWLTRAVSWLGLDVFVSALIVTAIASLAAGLFLFRLTQKDDGEENARYAVWFLLIYPTAYFLHLPYTEATLLALAVGCFLAAREKRWAVAGILGALASMTRLPGIILFPAIGMEAWEQYRSTRRFDRRWLWLTIMPSGLALYLWLNYHVAGDPFAFKNYLKENFYQQLDTPWKGLQNVYGVFFSDDRQFAIMSGVAEMLFSLLAIGMTVWSWFTLRASYSVWMTGNMLLCICDRFIVSVPRYTLTMFPIFVLFARASRGRPLTFALISFPSLVLYTFFATKFALGHWAF